MWDSAFARFWRILRGGLAHYRLDKSLRPPLESHQNHRKILESCAICLKAQILPPTYFCIKHFLTLLAQLLESFAACLKLPESSFPSLRGEAEAIHKNNAESMDCHAHQAARNDRKTAPSKKADSSYNAPLSSQASNAPSPSLRALRQQGVAIHKQEKQKGI